MNKVKLSGITREFLSDLKLSGSPKSTLKTYTVFLNTFTKWVKDNDLDFTKLLPRNFKQFRNYLINHGYASVTVNKHIHVVKSFYDFLVEEEVINGNPILTRRLHITEPKHTPSFLTDQEVETILDYFEKRPAHVRLAMRTMLCTGLRISEVLRLAPADLILMNQNGEASLFVHVYEGKGRKDRYVPVTNKETAKELLQYKDKVTTPTLFKIGVSTLGYHATECTKATGIHFHCHRLRHTLATGLLSQGWSLDVVQDVLGHENINTTRRYAATLPAAFFPLAAKISS